MAWRMLRWHVTQMEMLLITLYKEMTDLQVKLSQNLWDPKMSVAMKAIVSSITMWLRAKRLVIKLVGLCLCSRKNVTTRKSRRTVLAEIPKAISEKKHFLCHGHRRVGCFCSSYGGKKHTGHIWKWRRKLIWYLLLSSSIPANTVALLKTYAPVNHSAPCPVSSCSSKTISTFFLFPSLSSHAWILFPTASSHSISLRKYALAG